MKKVFSFLAAAFMAVSMFATPYTITFKGTGTVSTSDGSTKLTTMDAIVADGANYLSAVENTTQVYTGRSVVYGESDTVSLGIKMGSSSAAGTLKLVLATATEVDSVVVRAAQYGDTEGQNGFTVNGQQVTLSAGNKVLENKAVVLTGSVASIEIIQTTANKGRFYLQSVTVYPKAGGSEPTPGPEYVVDGFIAGTLTPATPASLATGLGANNRGGIALKENGLYFCNNATGFMSKMELDLSAIAAVTDSTAKGHYMQEDQAGNVVVWAWTVGSATLDVAQVFDANFQAVRNDSLAIDGRTDMPSVAGNVLQGRGAYFACGAGKNTVLRFNLVDGVMTTVDTITLPFTASGINYVSALDVDHFYVQGRGNGVAVVDMSGDAPVVTNMPFFQQVGLFTSTHGGTAFEFAGHILYAMGTYKVEGYLGSFAIFDVTDPANVYQIAEDRTKAGTSGLGTSCATFRVKVEGQTATLYEYAAQTVRKYTLTVTPACYIKQGNEGAEWVSMTAGENGFTYEAVLAADSLYINGAAADAGATMFRLADATVNGTVVVNDTVRFTYNNGALTIDLLGHFVPTVTFNVTVPENTPACYIAGTLNGWTFTRMSQLDATHYTYTWRADNASTTALGYKYCAGADWAYVEKGANGEELANRAYSESDTVRTWAAVPTVNTITYELNGGVMNDYGWTSKGAICMDLQNDFNAAYNATKEWVKWEDGVYYYKCGENWIAEDQAAGQASTVAGFIQNVTYNTSNQLKTLVETTQADKYAWLVEVIKANRDAQGLGIDEAAMVENVYRKELAGFFLASPAETSWPAASNFTTTAGADFYMPIWKHALSNPETVNAAFTLNDPYKEGFTFDGWYAAADFSDAKVTTIDENTASCTLYAKWIEYIPTLAEVTALADDAATKAAGVVTYMRGKNVYIQDATAGMLLYMNATPTFTVGQKVVVSGTKTLYGGAPEVKNAELVSAEDATLPLPQAKTLAALVAEPLKLFGQLVYVEGLKIVSYDDKGNAYVAAGADTVQCYYMTPDQTAMPVGTKVNVKAISGYYNKFQFCGETAWIEAVAAAAAENYSYPARGANGEYTLKNKWLFSEKMDNFSANKPASNDFARAMVAKTGIMYFPDREHKQLVRVNAATGVMMDPIAITGEHLFEVADSAGNYSAAVTLPFNDLKIDNAGHLLMGACVSGGQHFMIYKVDENTGAATLLIDERLYDNAEFGEELQGQATAWRFDAFGVYGDVDSHAIVMGADANSFNVYKWTIENGVAGVAEKIDASIDPDNDMSLLIKDGAVSVAAFGTAPQIFPVDWDYFYVDGWNTLPMLYDMDGVLADDFINCPTGVAIANNAGDTCTMNVGHNGLCEFQIGDEYFMVMAATNTVGTPNSSFALYKFADAAKSFEGLEPLWYFPAAGMGAATNGCRTAVPSVEVNQETGVATIYVYTNNNGYGVYEMKGVVATEDGLANTEADTNVIKIVENGQIYIIKNGVRYTVLGVTVK